MAIAWRLTRKPGIFRVGKRCDFARKGLAELKKLLESGDDGVVSIGFEENMGLVMKDKSRIVYAAHRWRLP